MQVNLWILFNLRSFISPNSDPKIVNHAIPSPVSVLESSKKRKDDNTFEKESKKQKPQDPSIQRAIKNKGGEQELCPECKTLHRRAGIDVITCPAYFYSRDYSTKVPRGKIPSSKAWKGIWRLVKHQFVVDGKYFTKDKWQWNGDIQLTPEFLEEVKCVLK